MEIQFLMEFYILFANRLWNLLSGELRCNGSGRFANILLPFKVQEDVARIFIEWSILITVSIIIMMIL